MVVYNKNMDKPGRAARTGSSPRDRQMRVAAEQSHDNTSATIISSLTEQVVQLRNELARRPTQGYTDEEFNTEVVKAVEASIAKEREANARYIKELEEKMKTQADRPETLSKIKELEGEITSLKAIIAGKDETIEALKTRPVNIVGGGTVETPADPARPQMDEAYIDPSEKKDYVSNISVTTKTSEKKDVSAQVDKLKNLLGGGIG